MRLTDSIPALALCFAAAACTPQQKPPVDAGSHAAVAAPASGAKNGPVVPATVATVDAAAPESSGPSLAELYPSLGDEEIAPTPELEEEQQSEAEFLANAPSIAGVKLDPKALSDEYDIPMEVTPLVEQFVVYFQTKGRKWYATWLSRSGRYLPMMRGVFKENGLPQDLTFLAMIESGFSNKAWSRTKASGPWQFMKGTGGRYGLDDDWWVDDRRDPEMATRAAASHLKDLYEEFGDWYLAAAAYNAGAGKINHAIDKYNTRNYWQMCASGRYLRPETKQYVPKLIAAAIIAKHPEEFGFSGIEYLDPLAYETVVVPDATDLRVVAECAGADYDSVCELNPALKRMCTPPGQNWEVRVPSGTSAQFAEAYATLDAKKRVTFRRHTVVVGDTPSSLARKYGTDVDGILRMNHLASARSLRVKQDLVIPVPVGNHALSAADLAPLPDAGKPRRGAASVYADDSDNAKIQRSIAAAAANAPKDSPKIDLRDTSPRDNAKRVPVAEGKDFVPPPNREKVKVTLATGDTLWKVSQEYGVSVQQIKRWNGIQNHRGVQAGDSLTLYVAKDKVASVPSNTAVADAGPVAAGAIATSGASSADMVSYKVKKGDTLWDIAREHNVDPLELMKSNNLSRHSKIKPGDVISIKLAQQH